MVTANLAAFIKTKLRQLAELHVDVKDLELDHFAYQASSAADYEQLKLETAQIADLQWETMVGERRVAIFKLKTPVKYLNYSLTALELLEPKPGQVCNSELDHVEFVLRGSFQDFADKYPAVNWDLTSMDRIQFPKVTYKFPDGTRVKLHLKNILEER